jgi:hypothetical protein
MRGTTILAAAAVSATVSAAPALADDAGLYAAYTGHQPKLDHAVHEYHLASLRWQRSHGRALAAVRRLARAEARVATIQRRVIANIRARKASSVGGARAKPLAVAAYVHSVRGEVHEMRALRSYIRHGFTPRWDREYRLCNAELRRSERYFKRADSAFRRAGFDGTPHHPGGH